MTDPGNINDDAPGLARTILITGATDGLGRALAGRLAAEGANVILHGRDQGRLDDVADEIARRVDGRRPATARADLADLTQVRDLSRQIGELTDRLDVLVNNAGIGAGDRPGANGRSPSTASNCGSPSTTSPGST